MRKPFVYISTFDGWTNVHQEDNVDTLHIDWDELQHGADYEITDIQLIRRNVMELMPDTEFWINSKQGILLELDNLIQHLIDSEDQRLKNLMELKLAEENAQLRDIAAAKNLLTQAGYTVEKT